MTAVDECYTGLIHLVLEVPITSFCENSGMCLAWNRGINLKHRQLGRERKLFGVIYEYFHSGFKIAEAKVMKKKQKKRKEWYNLTSIWRSIHQLTPSCVLLRQGNFTRLRLGRRDLVR